jgi:hypothetical protein
MVKFDGFNEKGEVVVKPCVTHKFYELPMKGLGKSMEGVGLDEVVIISEFDIRDNVIWGYTKAEIDRRAFELGAEVKWLDRAPEPPDYERRIEICFIDQVRKK